MPARKSLFLLLATLLLVDACGQESVQTRQLIAFGTIVTVKYSGIDAPRADEITAVLEADYRQLDRDWYPWEREIDDGTGELKQLNHAKREGRVFEISASLKSLIDRALALEDLSGGRFSITTAALTRAWGLHDLENPPQQVPDPEYLRSLPRAEIDLGGIAKGALLKHSAERLRELGIANAIVDLGGDLIVLGKVEGRAAVIGIRSPGLDSAIATLKVDDGEAVMTSGDYERFIEIDGQRFPHIIDPRTGWPVTHASSATVVHSDPLLADAAATALIVGGIDEFDDVCEEMGLEYAFLLSKSGERRLTPGMAERVKWTDK